MYLKIHEWKVGRVLWEGERHQVRVPLLPRNAETVDELNDVTAFHNFVRIKVHLIKICFISF